MRITQRQFGDATVLELHGALTVPAAPELLDATVRKVLRGNPRRLVLNLEDVPSIDAAGLGALVAAYGAVKRTGGSLKLARVTRRVHTLLVVCRLITVFETCESVEDAVADSSRARLNGPPAGCPAPQLSQTSANVIQHFLQRA